MDAFSLFTGLFGTAWTIASFLVVLGVVVFIHEFGHYIVARWCGIRSEVFSIGFGKEIWGWNDSRGTRWRVAVLPLGGYVKFLGDSDAASARADLHTLSEMDARERARSFPGAALWRRALTVAAGPAFNFILAIAIYAGLALSLGVGSDRPVVGSVAEGAADFPLQPGDEILAVDGVTVTSFSEVAAAYDANPAGPVEVALRRDGATLTVSTGPLIPPVVGGVAPDSPAERAGLEAGDRIAAINGEPVRAFSDLQRIVAASAGAEVTLRLADGDELSLTPMMNPTRGPDGVEMRPLIGITALPMFGPEARTPGPLEAVGIGAERTWDIIAMSLTYVGAIISGEADSSGLGGPIKIASLSGEASAAGVVTFLGMIAMISASIGMINLFPVPVLDGGHLVFYAIEALRGRPLGEKATEAATGLGFAMVVLLMVFVTYNDLMGL